MNNLFVYREIEDGVIADVSLELLTKGCSLANQLHCKLEALVSVISSTMSQHKYLPMGSIPFIWPMMRASTLIPRSRMPRY